MADIFRTHEEMKKQFPSFSLHCSLMNIDIVGIWILKTGQAMTILYRQSLKIGFIYEMEGLSVEKQHKIYQDVPEYFQDLEDWEEKLRGRVQVVRPKLDHFVWLSDREISKVKILSKKNKY